MTDNIEYEARRSSKVRAITVSVLIIAVCLSVLVGTTYALFTSGDDGKIGINATSGDVRVNIIDDAGESLINETLEFEVNGKSEYLLFEPGACIYTEGFRVINSGTLPIKYRIYISADESLTSSDITEAFDLYIVKSLGDIGKPDPIMKFEGALDVGDTSDTFFLVIKMKETAGNNFQNKKYTGIGITVHAVQSNGALAPDPFPDND